VTIEQEDVSKYFIVAWCIHPDLIPQEKIMAIHEPKVPFVIEPPLFFRRH